jgi:hypothetical protein
MKNKHQWYQRQNGGRNNMKARQWRNENENDETS